MQSISSSSVRVSGDVRSETARRHIRGSNLMLLGRLIALVTNFGVHVLTVRYLAKADYGALAYGLAVANIGANVILLGLPRSISRYASFFHEKRDYPAMFGSLVLATGVIVAAGAAVIGGAFLLRVPVVEPLVGDPLAVSLLLVLIALAPLNALDSLFQSMLAVFCSPLAIFFRRYVLGPLLKLGAVLLVIVVHGSVHVLALGYLAAGILGAAVYLPLLKRSLEREGLLQHWNPRALRLPCREILGFGMPLVLSEVLIVLRPTLAVLLLEYFGGTSQVADFKALAQVAGLNLIVMQSMKMLFLPAASRLYARGEHAAVESLFWQSAIWTSIMTFPAFAACVVLHEPLTLMICGEKYLPASHVLVALAIGEYANASLGLNSYTLQVYARVRHLVFSTLTATLFALALNLWLIPGLGALGAAIATSGAVIVQGLLNHVGLARSTPIGILRWKYGCVYVSVAATVLVLCAVHLAALPLLLEGVLVACASLFLLRLHRETMELHRVFPELNRLPPGLAWLVGARRAPGSARG